MTRATTTTTTTTTTTPTHTQQQQQSNDDTNSVAPAFTRRRRCSCSSTFATKQQSWTQLSPSPLSTRKTGSLSMSVAGTSGQTMQQDRLDRLDSCGVSLSNRKNSSMERLSSCLLTNMDATDSKRTVTRCPLEMYLRSP